LVEGAPAVVEVRQRLGGGAQSFPVVVSNWRLRDDALEIGFAFGKLKRRHYQAIGELMFGDAKEIAAFREGRRRRYGILHGVVTFFAWSFAGPPRGFQLLLSAWRARQAARRPPRPDAAVPEIAAPAPALEPAARAASA
jgi:hypothetical protein